MSNTHRPKAALLEIYDSHDVNLYSQLAFLKSGGYETTLICSENLRQQVSDYHIGEKVVFVNCTDKKNLPLLLELWKINRFIVQEGFDVVVLNTAHGSIIRNLCLMPYPKKIKFIGNLHGVNKLTGSTTQNLISSRVKRYFLLSEYMKDKAMKVPHCSLQFEVYYPMFHPDFPDVAIQEKPANESWVCIPGAVEYKRRDYETLILKFASIADKPRVKFILLGNGNHVEGNGPEIQQKVKTLGLEQYFIFFNNFVGNSLFHKYVKACDAIFPLIHPINADMEKYLENQISGSFHLAYSYRKPLLMHNFFSRYNEFSDNSIFYDLDNID
jgi:hypothetical protein